jgi:hypothetical protein
LDRIKKIELERTEVLTRIGPKIIGKEVIETQIGTIDYLLNLLAHLFRNKITAMGGLCRRIDKMAVAGNNGKNGDCVKCSEKTRNVVREARALEQIMIKFELALADIKKATVINLEHVPLTGLISDIQAEDPTSDFLIELEDTDSGFLLRTDKRKTVKAMCRMVKKLTQENKNPVRVSARKVDNERVKISLTQREINTDHLARLISVARNENATDHSLNDFVVIISSILLQELGIILEVDTSVVDFTFMGTVH